MPFNLKALGHQPLAPKTGADLFGAGMDVFVPIDAAVVFLNNGIITRPWLGWAQDVTGAISSLATVVGGFPSAGAFFTLATQPVYGPANAGASGFILPFGHWVRWSGTVWEFMPGAVGNGFFRPFAITPQETGWALCDGAATTYLQVGGPTLTEVGFTTPNLSATAAYLKSGAAYSGVINPATGATGAGGAAGVATIAAGSHTHGGTQPAGAHGHTGSADGVGDHTHHVSGGTSTPDSTRGTDDGSNWQAANTAHRHSFAVDSLGGGAHGHALTINGAADHTHGIGADGVHSHTVTLPDHTHPMTGVEPPNLGVRVYFRR